MKKILAFSLIVLFSATGLAADNFNSKTGVLEIPDLNIDSVPYGSATLKLNNSGTFSVIDAKPASKPIQNTFTTNGYTFTQLGCKRSGTTEVTCEMQVVNDLKDRSLSITSNSNKSFLNDDLGNTYGLSRVSSGGNFVINYVSGYWGLPTMYKNAPTKMGFVFNDVDKNAKSIPKFVIWFYEPDAYNSFGITVSNSSL